VPEAPTPAVPAIPTRKAPAGKVKARAQKGTKD
jgi:hypothetical protein